MDGLLVYGPLGIFALLFVTGQLIPKPIHDRIVDRLIAERDRAERRSEGLVDDVHSKVVPALERSIETAKEREVRDSAIQGLLDGTQDVLVDVRRLLEGRT